MDSKSDKDHFYLLVGTYTKGKGEGIYTYRFNQQTGKTDFITNTKGVDNPSFLTVSPDHRFIFAVNESGNTDNDSVSAFEFNNQTGSLEFINKVSSGGIDPCYLITDKKGTHLFVANYTSGTISVIRILANGFLSEPVQVIQHTGKSIVPGRQDKAHAHAVMFSPDSQYLYAADLGTDKVYCYRYQHENADTPLEPIKEAEIIIDEGGGPRHLVFSKDGKYAYVILELNASILVFRCNNGTLLRLQTVQMEEINSPETHSAADIHLSADGKFLYASNRGTANCIVMYAVDPQNGTLQFAGRTSTLGRTPRNFLIAPNDNYLLVANQDSNFISVFRRDRQTGMLEYTGNRIEIESPVFLMMIQ
jgi:6-phosphogluconolactonase